MLVDRLNSTARRVPTWIVYAGLSLPAPWLFWQGLTGGLGVEPIKALEHEYGLLALQLLIAGLCVTPLRRFAGVNLLRFRRGLGLMAFFYLCCHLLVWLVLDVQILAQVWADILKRPYITVGMAGFLLLVPLALTSTDRAIRRMGMRWRQLHWLVYPAVLLGGLHFVMLRKGWQLEPLVYLGLVAILLLLRLAPRRKRVAAHA
ncbi:protein-methionine-sulfoxide reductase heme-binding subunit MsrQ [Thetidibacter halocola]|uniref:Protein-methionine-sulfoxide reductase heme-binding subunit MsrQ n=1 Tax=Thetidibacter halocola TaxID=2827239 RepID=A0A8J7W9F5_9RHOB|nr:protein-methionine-sulfoxide reductase heme-binding subunit MsrQ [Thetidibacter halocola]MBS0123352.1 protein-methionine-sulfoxide reductase heme-binding subunit MsrQ [Thetidibacter halocola]